MSLKNILCAAAIAALAVTSADAQTLRVSDAGLGANGRIFEVYATPDSTPSSLAAELGFDATAASNTTVNSATNGPNWIDDGVAPIGNPGNNPFTGTVTEGISIDGDTVFAALGSGIENGETLVFSFELDDPIAVLDLVGSSLIAEDGSTTAVSGTFGINGDFDLNGNVDIIDFGVFGDEFVNNATPGAGSPADFDGVNGVDIIDFGVFGANFGLDVANNGAGSGSAVPEPASALLIGLLLSSVGFLRRR